MGEIRSKRCEGVGITWERSREVTKSSCNASASLSRAVPLAAMSGRPCALPMRCHTEPRSRNARSISAAMETNGYVAVQSFALDSVSKSPLR